MTFDDWWAEQGETLKNADARNIAQAAWIMSREESRQRRVIVNDVEGELIKFISRQCLDCDYNVTVTDDNIIINVGYFAGCADLTLSRTIPVIGFKKENLLAEFEDMFYGEVSK